MALKLDDFLIKKKEPVQILDLSKGSANSYEELKKMIEKVPEYKIKMDKIRPEEVKTFEKKLSSKMWSEDAEKMAHGTGYAFANPIPCDMRSLRLEDLCSVNIQWKMLTSLRPKIKSDEEYFSKLVELGKLQLRARQTERNKSLTWYVRKSKNKAGIKETKITSCRECGEEFCLNETCRLFAYDSYERCALTTSNEGQLADHQQPNNAHQVNAKNTKKPKNRAPAKKQRKRNASAAAAAPAPPPVSRSKRGRRGPRTGSRTTKNTLIDAAAAAAGKTIVRASARGTKNRTISKVAAN